MAAKKKSVPSFKKELTRSKNERIVAGVIGGVSEYFDVDATLLRIIFLLVLALTGFAPGVVAYIIAALIMPEKKSKKK